MKKYITGIFAVVIAVSAVAFTLPKNNYTTKFFTFSGADYKDATVKSPGSWTFSGTSHDAGCPGTNVRACEIEVNTMFVNPDNTLKPLSIQTASSSTDVYYVVPGGDVTSRSNRN